MFEIPQLGDTALVLSIVGALFLLRFVLAVRRLRQASGRGNVGSLWDDAGRVTTPAAFGPDLEPERRHAVRQFTAGAALSASGLALAVWMLLFGDGADVAAGSGAFFS